VQKLATAALIFAFLSGTAAAAEEIIELLTRRGAIQPYLLSLEPAHEYAAVALLFTGGDGRVGLRNRGIPNPGANFLVRTRGLFVKNGIATAVIDAPSDEDALTDAFRLGSVHADDVALVVADLAQRVPRAKIFPVGTSRGTISAAAAAAVLADKVHGVVLTSTLFVSSRAGPGLSSFDYGSITVPALFVHHRDDACTLTPYSAAERLSSRFTLISVSGGDAPRSGPCDPFHYHGYLGREEAVVEAISAWMLGRAFPRDIR
jgi:pimeloyl-ACP methyl ester carboxylesterase